MELTYASHHQPQVRSTRRTVMASAGVLLLMIAAAAIYVAIMANEASDLPADPAPVQSGNVSPEQVAQLITSDPAALKPLSVHDAVGANSAIAIAPVANPASLPLIISGRPEDYARALECMAAAIYYEAGNESVDGRRAVAQVILNRVRHAAYPKSVCGVVYQGSERRTGCQFSFTCDGSLQRRPQPSSWLRARALAAEALNGRVYAPVGLSTHYHANYVLPYWAPTLLKTAVLGTHIFYRWNGTAGTQVAFREAYAGESASRGVLPVDAPAPALAHDDGTSAILTERRVLDQNVVAEDEQGSKRAHSTDTPLVAGRWVLGASPASPPSGPAIAMNAAPILK